MKNLMKSFLFASTMIVTLPSASHASLLKILGGNSFVTTSNNDYSSNWAGRSSMLNPLTISTTSNNVSLKFEYIYRESSTLSSFIWGGSSPNLFLNISIPNMSTPSSPPTFFDTVPTSSNLPFWFISLLNPIDPLSNGQSSKPTLLNPLQRYSFFVSFNDPFDTTNKSKPVINGQTGDTVWLAFDDGGRSSSLFADMDYDDMIIKITAFIANTSVDVPEPGTLALLLMSLFGLTMIRSNFIYNLKNS